MREIKFRAWDRVLKTMCNVQTIRFADMTISFISKGCSQPNRTLDSVELMQYTGLKDKNGKGEEIYVGDLLKDPQGNIGEVFYLAPSFAIRWKRRDGSWDTDCCFGYGEIIGTAMENKELLEGE